MKVWVGGAILVVAILLGLVPLALGHLAMAGHRALLAELIAGRPEREILQQSEHRGWLASTAEVELMIRPVAGEQPAYPPLRVRLDSRIEQAPWVWLRPTRTPVIGRVATRAEIQGLPIVLPVFTAETQLYLDGSGLVRLGAAAGETRPTASALGLRHGPIEGELQLPPDHQSVSGWLSAPDLQIRDLEGPLARLVGLRLDATWRGDLGLDGRLAIARLALDTTAARAVALPNQSSALRITGLEVDLKGVERAGVLDLSMALAAAQIRTLSDTLGPVELGLVAERWEKETLADLGTALNLLRSQQGSAELRGLVVASQLATLLPRLLASGARVVLDPIRVQTPEGLAAGRFDLQFDPSARVPSWLSAGPEDWLALVQAAAELKLPEAAALTLLERLAVSRGRSAETVASLRDESRQRLADWIQLGWVRRDGDQVSSVARLAGGRLTLNGQYLPLH
jgi:hypothetical protein